MTKSKGLIGQNSEVLNYIDMRDVLITNIERGNMG